MKINLDFPIIRLLIKQFQKPNCQNAKTGETRMTDLICCNAPESRKFPIMINDRSKKSRYSDKKLENN